MNKEQSADDPSVDLIRVKNMLNSTISMSYPDVVIACIEHKVSRKHSEQLRQRWWSTIILWRIIPCGWLITITANHSNYLVCDRANTQSVTVRKVVKPQLNYWAMPLQLSEFTISSCSEGRTRRSFFITFNWCICSLFLTLVSDGRLQWPRLRNSRTLFCSRAMLICSIIWLESGCCGLLFCGFCSSLTWGCPVFSVADLYCLKLFLR